MRRTHAYILRRLVGFLTITTSVVVAFTTRPSSLFLHKKRQPATERFLPTRNSRPSTLARSLINERDDATISVPGEYYPIADDPDYDSVSAAWSDRPPRYDAAWFTIVFVPILTPIVAFLTYDYVAATFDFFIEALSWDRSWAPVDGGAFQAKIITPAINGVVLPAIAVLFATLTSTTISTMRARQVDVRRCLNNEAGELRAMEYLVSAYKVPDIQLKCRQCLMQYCGRIIAESQPDWASSGIIDPRRGMDSELYGVLDCLTYDLGGTSNAIVDASFASITRLRTARQERITALHSTYPTLHYWILSILAFGECTGFLMEGNQELLVFLNAIQLKILWSMLVATFVACFTVFFDLLNPFNGGYQVSASVDQLYTIRLALKAESELSVLRDEHSRTNGEKEKLNEETTEGTKEDISL